MKNLLSYAKFCFILSLILLSLSCGFLPKNDCELVESDGENILGMDVKAIDKTSPVFGGSSESKDDPNLRACGYVYKNPAERGYLYLTQVKTDASEKAKMLFESVNKKSSEAINYSSEPIIGTGEAANLSRYETRDSKNLQIAVRKGKNAFLLTVSKPLTGEISVEEVKSLAKRIADNTFDY